MQRLRDSLPVFKGRYPADKREADAARRALAQIDVRANRAEIAERVVKMLHHYFIANAPTEAIEAVANDWIAELEEYPLWAIKAACTWWVSRHNPDNARKPVPGQISARAQREAGIIIAAKQQLKMFDKYGENPPKFLVN